MVSPKRFNDGNSNDALSNDLFSLASEYLVKQLSLQTDFVSGFQKQCQDFYLKANECKTDYSALAEENAAFLKSLSDYTSDHVEKMVSLFTEEIGKGQDLFSEGLEAVTGKQQTTVHFNEVETSSDDKERPLEVSPSQTAHYNRVRRHKKHKK